MQIELNLESAAVLLRALSYGESAISQQMVENGEAKVVEENTQLIRAQLCRRIHSCIICRTAEKKKGNVL